MLIIDHQKHYLLTKPIYSKNAYSTNENRSRIIHEQQMELLMLQPLIMKWNPSRNHSFIYHCTFYLKCKHEPNGTTNKKTPASVNGITSASLTSLPTPYIEFSSEFIEFTIRQNSKAVDLPSSWNVKRQNIRERLSNLRTRTVTIISETHRLSLLCSLAT
jgi:hypothetical protein